MIISSDVKITVDLDTLVEGLEEGTLPIELLQQVIKDTNVKPTQQEINIES